MAEILESKVALVTGAGRGIGRGIAVEFAREGAKVIVASRSQWSVDRTVEQILAEGNSAVGIRCDVGIKNDIERAVSFAVEQFGGLDILVNNAQSFGSAERPTPAPMLTPLEMLDDGNGRTFFARAQQQRCGR